MNRRTGSLVPAILAIATMPATAQWPNYPTPGIPRLPDGKPNLTAPAPKNRDGKPNLSGIWSADPQNPKYFGDVAVGFKAGEFPIQPWAETLTKQNSLAHSSGSFWMAVPCPKTRIQRGCATRLAGGKRIRW